MKSLGAYEKFVLVLALAGAVFGFVACLGCDRLVRQLCSTIPSAMGDLCGNGR